VRSSILCRTLTFIIKEMIDTERDYVKSLDYIIVNYIPELMREDIPQALRGQRNIIFGNVEKIYEFHSQHFLHELEGCESNPLQVGQIFLKHDKKFYLYALYNKNKPKSDSLMSEYGTLFFKVCTKSILASFVAFVTCLEFCRRFVARPYYYHVLKSNCLYCS
jgi:hypothetical protein